MTSPRRAAPRRINLQKPDAKQISKLRKDAYVLLDFPELLDQREWRLSALAIARAFIAQNPQRPLGPRGIAALVDESIEYRLKQDIPIAEAIQAARKLYADLLSRQYDSVKKAHTRYGKPRHETKPT